MDWSRALPDFDARWIVSDARGLLVVDKPPFIPSQAADPAHADDLATRLARFLGARGEPDYLGVHQRLDKDTSGLVVFVRDPRENARVAEAFEGRRARKRYLACVEGWRGAGRTLDDLVAPGDRGRMTVARGRARGAKRAVTRVRVLERTGARALLELELETGRTHQARVQLAHAGAPIAGDALYGGPRAPRLMLHASALELPGLRATSAAPPELGEWLARGDLGAAAYDDEGALARRIAWAAQKRWALARGGETTAFRLVHDEGDALPALAVDALGGFFVVHFEDRPGVWTDARRERVLGALAALEPDGIYVKVRRRGQAGARPDDAPSEPARGARAPTPLLVREDGLVFAVRLDAGPAVGLYLDQRRNRARVRAAAGGKRVLNLFAYTCAFTAAAAAGGARETVSVDASAAALERGRENVLRTTGDLARHSFVMDDAAAVLARAARKGERFDLVVLDPPSFGRAGARSFQTARDYGDLARACACVLAEGGALLACTNHRGTSQGALRKAVRDAAVLAGRRVAQLKDLSLGADFPGEPTMKSVWLRVD